MGEFWCSLSSLICFLRYLFGWMMVTVRYGIIPQVFS